MLVLAWWSGPRARTLGAALALGGAAFSLYLTVVELFVIDAICQWCVASAVCWCVLGVVEALRFWRAGLAAAHPSRRDARGRVRDDRRYHGRHGAAAPAVRRHGHPRAAPAGARAARAGGPRGPRARLGRGRGARPRGRALGATRTSTSPMARRPSTARSGAARGSGWRSGRPRARWCRCATASSTSTRRAGRSRWWSRRSAPTGEGELLRRVQETLAPPRAPTASADPARRPPLPRFPRKVGVDRRPRLRRPPRRRHRHPPALPAVALRAQDRAGAGRPRACRSMTAALARLAVEPEVDVIVLARGGGSCRTSTRSPTRGSAGPSPPAPVPVVTSIGHTRQRPNCDHVAAGCATCPRRPPSWWCPAPRSSPPASSASRPRSATRPPGAAGARPRAADARGGRVGALRRLLRRSPPGARARRPAARRRVPHRPRTRPCAARPLTTPLVPRATARLAAARRGVDTSPRRWCRAPPTASPGRAARSQPPARWSTRGTGSAAATRSCGAATARRAAAGSLRRATRGRGAGRRHGAATVDAVERSRPRSRPGARPRSPRRSASRPGWSAWRPSLRGSTAPT